MRITLFKKGLLLLLFPVIVQLVAVAALTQKYEEVTRGLNYQLEAMRIGRTFAEAGEITMQMSDYLLRDAKDPNAQSYGPALEAYGRLAVKLDELKSTQSQFKDIDRCAKSLGEITSRHMTYFSEKALDSQNNSEMHDNIWYLDTFRSLYKEMAPYQKWLFERPASPALTQFTSKTISDTITILIAVNIGTAFLLWWMINRSIVGQVNHLKSNFDRLAHNLPLLEPLKGTDEVADFDRAFQEIGRSVERLRRERTEYLEIMNSTMREPLQKLQLTLERLEQRPSETMTAKGKLKLEASSRTISRLVTMLNELIDYEQIDQGTFKLAYRETVVTRLVSDAIECIADRAQGAGIKIEFGGSDLVFNADPDRLIQVLVNLLTNAIKFSPRGSTVTVTVEDKKGDTVFCVIDRGPGIEPEMQTKIFQKFEQVDQTRDSIAKKGTGLGLAICKIIVETHGGEIWVESDPGKGSTFKFSIPHTELTN
jgi:signal transduction histidine kinase